MSATQEITARTISENIQRAVPHVFQTMLGKMPPMTFSHQQEDLSGKHSSTVEGQQYVVGSVGFIGETNGLIYLYFPLPFARLCTKNLLGMTDRELDDGGDETVNDAIGELTNMTVGTFKNTLCDAGHSCMLTMPSILRGNNFSVEPVSSTIRNLYHFDCAGHRLVADILMKLGD